jgi:hypothetical protein
MLQKGYIEELSQAEHVCLPRPMEVRERDDGENLCT